ncbi:MAG: type II secretion system protein [Chthonomonas sp.]|nr:type II secretion system protein [Chthonomonas sp.]
MKRAFTLVELMVVLVIVTILSALLLPVFRSARASALSAACLAQAKSVVAGHLLYMSDYDDRFVPSSYRGPNGGDPITDRKWPQLLQPYVRGYSSFTCPEDHEIRPTVESVFNADLSLADPVTRSYVIAQRTNYGYNGVFLAPMIQSDRGFIAVPTSYSSLAYPADTVQLVDSVWDVVNGRPTGGGRYLIQPPCRIRIEFGREIDGSIDQAGGLGEVIGWNPGQSPSEDSYGGAWPWHSGMLTTAFADGHVQKLRPAALENGCEVRKNWMGSIRNSSLYLYDLE